MVVMPPQPPSAQTPKPSGTATGNATDSVGASADASTGKMDLVDMTLYCGFALMLDGIGLIPVAGEALSPVSIAGFRLFFWLKDVNPSSANWMMGASAGAEFIPVVSEVLPGCTAYVLTVCLSQALDDKLAKAAGAIAASPVVPPQARLVAAGAGAAINMSKGQDAGEAIKEQAGNLASGAAGGAGAAAASGGAAAGGAAAGAAGGTPGASISMGSEGQEFSGQFDFSSVGRSVEGSNEEERAPSGLPQQGPAEGKENLPGSTEETGEGLRFAGGSPTSPDKGWIASTTAKIYSLAESRRRKKQRELANKKKAAA